MAPTIEFFDGFDMSGHPSHILRYPDATQSPINQGTAATGRFESDALYFDKSFQVFNTGFNRVEYRQSLSTVTAEVYMGGHFRFYNSIGSPWTTELEFFQLENEDSGGYKQVALSCDADHRLKLYTGGTFVGNHALSGTLAFTSDADFLPELEHLWFDFYFDASTNVFRVWREGVLEIDTVLATLKHPSAPSNYTQASLTWQHFGFHAMRCDNYALAVDERVQEGRVTTQWIAEYPEADYAPGSYSVVNAQIPSPLPPIFAGALREKGDNTSGQYPDMDVSYLQGSGAAEFLLARCFPVGEILAARVYITCKAVSSSATVRARVRRGLSVIESLDAYVVGSSDYETLQFAFALDPISGAAWSEQDFADSASKFGWNSDNTIRVTQLAVSRFHRIEGGIGALYRAR